MLDKGARTISRLAVCCALAVVFQAAPVFLPGMGLAVSPMASLPLLVAALLPGPGLYCLAASSFLVLMVAPEEFPILLFMTGPVGYAAGWAVRSGPPGAKAIVPGLFLALGMTALRFGVGIPPLGPMTAGFAAHWEILAMTGFGLLYGFLWVAIGSWVRGRFRGLG